MSPRSVILAIVSLTPVIMFVSLAIVSVTLSCAGAQKGREAQAHYKLGVSHLSTGSIQSAFVEFQRALELDPDNEDVLNAVGVVYLKLDDFKRAEESFLKAVRRKPGYSEAHNNLCYVYLNIDQLEEAVKSCSKALENQLYQTPEKAFYNLGRASYGLGRYDEAISAFINARRRRPGLYPAYYGLSLSYNAKRMYGDAASAITKAVELDPRFRGDRDKAEEDFQKGAMASPDEEIWSGEDYRDFLEILKY